MERSQKVFRSYEEFERDVLRREEMDGSVADLYDHPYVEELNFDGPSDRRRRDHEDDEDDE